jgi:hypothetical protein
MNSDNVSQMASCIAAFLALSKSVFTCVTTSLTRFSASAWLSPVLGDDLGDVGPIIGAKVVSVVETC